MMSSYLQGGLDVLRRMARNGRSKKHRWKTHCRLMRMAAEHVQACGAPWEAYESALACEFAELLGL